MFIKKLNQPIVIFESLTALGECGKYYFLKYRTEKELYWIISEDEEEVELRYLVGQLLA